jgi:hypothetical protein
MKHLPHLGKQFAVDLPQKKVEQEQTTAKAPPQNPLEA